MKSYRVTWEIDIEAETPTQAAIQAFELQQGPSGEGRSLTDPNAANVFNVDGQNIDLSSLRWALFNRFELYMTTEQAESASHPGPCDKDVAALLADPDIIAQLDVLNPDDIRAELRECGAWGAKDAAELADDQLNRTRLVWIAAGMIDELVDEHNVLYSGGSVRGQAWKRS